VAKLCAFREKDRNFVAALVAARFVDVETIRARLLTVHDRHHGAAGRALNWLTAGR
jgi:hypothetical protein